MDNDAIKSNIYNFRKRHRLTQAEIAGLIGISVTAYRELERGGTSIINPNIVKMADVLETTPEELVFGYGAAEQGSDTLEDIQAQYGSRMRNLEDQIENLEKLVVSLEEIIASKNEIISMLKKMLAEQK